MPDQLRIFIAEDNHADVLLLEEVMLSQGIEARIQVANNGEAAVAALEEMTAADAPGLLVIDLNLPRIDGMELLQQVRSSAKFERTPVMILTSSQSAEDRLRAETLGANAFVSKPLTLPEYLATVGAAVRSLIGGPRRPGVSGGVRRRRRRRLPLPPDRRRRFRRYALRSGGSVRVRQRAGF